MTRRVELNASEIKFHFRVMRIDIHSATPNSLSEQADSFAPLAVVPPLASNACTTTKDATSGGGWRTASQTTPQ